MTKIQNVACLVLVSVLAVHCLGDESAQPASASNESDTTQTGDVKRIAAQARPSIVQITFSGRDGKQQGLGTGFIISTDGLIATNLHVIGEARPIAVELADKRTFAVQSIHASDRGLDLAIVRIDAKNLPALRLGDSDAAQDGEAVIAMGNPHGLTNSVVSGVVSGRREIDGRQMIQLAMPIEPGNSGGPVLDQRGRVLGIVTMKSLITQNLGFAVEVNTLKPLIEKPNPIPLFSDNGFHGGRTNYYHRANSYLSSVLDDREGLPITLSVLHMELGRRIGLKIDGVGLPGHFVVRFMPTEGEEQLVDPFDGGKLLTREDADRLVRSFAGRPLHDEDLRASTNREIVLRMLRNLLGVAQAEDDKEAMLRYTEAMLVVEPDLIQERGMRAVLRFQTGRRDAAIADLDWFLDKQPEGIDPDQIRQMREMFRTRKP